MPLRGFKDHLPPSSYLIEHIRKIFQSVSTSYGVNFIDLPLVEEAELYFRTSGEQSDVCNKELFEVRRYKDEFKNWVLRPEGTASCIRAVKEQNYMQDNKFARFAYFAPMFRYNRPQNVRYRQFLHAGWEFLGNNSVAADYEILCGALEIIKMCGLSFVLEINSIGTANDRKIYRDVLKNALNLDSDQDPLKVLDKMDEFSSKIPVMEINENDARNFEKLKAMLDKSGIDYVHNPYLVRGLDYYNALVFELKVDGVTVLAGGRYDYLMEQIQGKPLSAIGFAAGVDRLMHFMNYEHKNDVVAILSLDDDLYTHEIATKVRNLGLSCVVFWGLDMKKGLSLADKQKHKFVIMVNENSCILKNLETGHQKICLNEFTLSDFSI